MEGCRRRVGWWSCRIGPDGLVHRWRRLADVETPSVPEVVPGGAAPVRPEARQRWRVTFAREASDGPAGRDYVALWETALAGSGLPVATTDADRPRFALAAPLPSRTAGHAELADIWLTQRRAAWQVREALVPVLPSGHELVSLEDVWLGAPALAGRVAAADYVVTVAAPNSAPALDASARRVLGMDRIMRERAKGGGVRTYDLRQLLISLEALAAPGDCVEVRIRTRIHPELGSGRPDEVIAVLAEEGGTVLDVRETVREGLVLADELPR
jgi:hypothetical protein